MFKENGELYLNADDFRTLREYIGSKKGAPIVTVVNEGVNDDDELETTAIAPATIPANWEEILEEAMARKIAQTNREELVQQVVDRLEESDIPPELREKKKEGMAIAILKFHRSRSAA